MSLVEALNYQFKKPELLQQALTHKSYHFDKDSDSSGHNEKLEFIGDAVIDLVVSEMLYEYFPTDEEGSLSKKRASLVNEEVLALLAERIKLSEYIRLGKGEKKTGGHKKPRLLASAYEALCGAVYLDGGFQACRKLLYEHFLPLLKDLDPSEDYARDYKTRVQESVQKIYKATPKYEVTKEEGPSHNPVFYVALTVNGTKVSEGVGSSKKQAEQMAAQKALEGGLNELKI